MLGFGKFFGRGLSPQLFLVLFALLPLASGAASDWPQFLGPTRNGIYSGDTLNQDRTSSGPPVVWKKKVGQGFSGPVVAGGKLIIFHRLENKEVIDCLDAQTGKGFWSFDYPTAYRDDFGFDEGPRATPAIDAGRVYTCGAEGMLHCIDLPSGKKIWSVNTKSQFRAAKGFFGIACSPLVQANCVLLNVGGREGSGVVAFDKSDGKVRWKASDEEASYSSPVVGTISSRLCALFLARSSLIAVDPESGKLLFQFPFRPAIHSSVTAAVPLLIGDKIFLSASYGTGATLLEAHDLSPKAVWHSDDAISAHYATPVYYKGYLYGIHGRTDPGFEPGATLRCVELESGKMIWEKAPFGAATLTLSGDQLLILTERGELIRAPASPDGFKETGRAQILSNQVRAHPALANGFFYARSKDMLVSVDLRKK